MWMHFQTKEVWHIIISDEQTVPPQEHQSRLNPGIISDFFQMYEIHDRLWKVVGSSDVTGAGLVEGMQWTREARRWQLLNEEG